jgi:hypothetical protein
VVARRIESVSRRNLRDAEARCELRAHRGGDHAGLASPATIRIRRTRTRVLIAPAERRRRSIRRSPSVYDPT